MSTVADVCLHILQHQRQIEPVPQNVHYLLYAHVVQLVMAATDGFHPKLFQEYQLVLTVIPSRWLSMSIQYTFPNHKMICCHSSYFISGKD